MKKKYNGILSVIIISLFTSLSYAQGACDIYVDNNTDCYIDIQFDLWEFSSTSATDCDDGLKCGDPRIDQTFWVTIPANTTGHFAINGSVFQQGGWGTARIADYDGTGVEEEHGDCIVNNDGECKCNTVNYSVQLTRTSSGVTAVIQ